MPIDPQKIHTNTSKHIIMCTKLRAQLMSYSLVAQSGPRLIDPSHSLFRFCLVFSKGDNGPRKSNWVGEDDCLKQKKQIKVKQFSFQAIVIFLFRRSMNKIQFLFNEGLLLKIKGSKIFLDQGDQLLIGLIKILQTSNDQNHLIVQIGVVL